MDEQEVSFLTRFVVESDAIEGIEDDPAEVKDHLQRGWGRNHRMAPGHAGAILWLRQMEKPLDERTLKRVHLFIVQEQHRQGQRRLLPREIGAWRMHDVCICTSDDITRPARRIGSRWQDVPEDMRHWLGRAELFDQRRGCRVQDAILEIAALHWRYERIHPFSDGNGRSGRALAYYQYRRAGLAPFVFTVRDRHLTYYPCFERPTPELMQRYFLERTSDDRAAR